jgi:alpha-beta hydrolase superfamily lysophospholipase
MRQKEVQFYSEGALVKGTLYLPDEAEGGAGAAASLPAVVFCHGFAGIRQYLLPPFAEAFCGAGFVCLTFDYRGFGESEGERGRLVPADQIADIRNALTFVETVEGVDARRIGLWGTSFGGANAIAVAAVDPRPRCLVVQVTFGDGERTVTAGMSSEEKAKLGSTLARSWQRLVQKNRQIMVEPDQILSDEESKEFYRKGVGELPAMRTKIPLLTLRHNMEAKPELLLSRVRVPLLIVAASQDRLCPPEESTSLYEKAGQPKELLVLEGARHYDVYEGAYFEQAVEKETAWFCSHLAR